MSWGDSINIFRNISSVEFSDDEKGTAILEVLRLRTHMGITKNQMLAVIAYLLPLAFDVPEDKKEILERWRR